MVTWVEKHTELRFVGGASVDYEPWQDGAGRGRSMGAQPYEAGKLGGDFKHLRPALYQIGAFNGMQIAAQDIAPFANTMRSPKAFLYSTAKFLRYVKDRLVHGRATRLVNGNAISAALLQAARQSGVTLWCNAPMLDLVSKNGAVTGVVTRHEGQDLEITAKAVVLASGGYGQNEAMRQAHIPLANHGWSLQPDGNKGDGIVAGVKAGGVFQTENMANGIWVPISVMVGGNAERSIFPHIMFDRHHPGLIAVTPQGRRFVNEGSSYQAFVNAMITQDIKSAWLIGTHEAIRRSSMGHAKPSPLPIGKYLKNGYLKKGETVFELAKAINVDFETLESTIRTFNGYARAGTDPDFKRGADRFSIEQGDPTHKPNPSLGALVKGPFYAIELLPGQLSTMNGLVTNANAQVVDADGKPIRGLYAVGVDANSIFHGAYPGGGSSIGPGMTFGYIAARHITGQA